jgi:ribosome-associated protein
MGSSSRPTVSIDSDELRFTYSRSSGPGGQNVNRVETRVTLYFDVPASRSLDEAQKRRILNRLSTRVNKEGVLRVVSQRHRTREANRRAAIERFHELLEQALARRRLRKKTTVSKAAKRRRLEEKRRRGDIKRTRSRPSGSDY